MDFRSVADYIIDSIAKFKFFMFLYLVDKDMHFGRRPGAMRRRGRRRLRTVAPTLHSINAQAAKAFPRPECRGAGVVPRSFTLLEGVAGDTRRQSIRYIRL